MSFTGKSPSNDNLNDLTLPSRLVIGVTGHRNVAPKPFQNQQIQSAIETIRKMRPPLSHTPITYTILSPLAEGADRAVVQEFLKIPNSILEVILPLIKDDYLLDFKTDESKKEFEHIFQQAQNIKILPPRPTREESYEQAGHYIVDQCDVLIALWDGKSSAGKGGTEEIVRYARETHCPLIWIHLDETDNITLDPGRGLNLKAFQYIDEYNTERVESSKFNKQLGEMRKRISDTAENTGLPSIKLTNIIDYTLGHFIRADILAFRYHHIYYQTESIIYGLALAAGFVAAFQNLFIPEQPLILLLEVILMFAVLAIVFISRRSRWHNKWIDYRFLAERFRSALFITITNIEISTLRPPLHLSLAYSPKDWMVVAFSSFWSRRPVIDKIEPSLLNNVQRFICEAWIQDQITYHSKTQIQYFKIHRGMTITSYTMFSLTICAALLHITGVGNQLLETFSAFMAIICPAIGTSITAIRTQRDYLRNSMRSAEMVRHLEEIKGKMSTVHEHNEFIDLLKETEETMLHENQDWRVVVRFHVPEVPT